MFRDDELKRIDFKYFDILDISDYDVTVRSRNTGHVWQIHDSGTEGTDHIAIFHKHREPDKYHFHGYANTLRQAIRMIQQHDKFQMNGRKTVR